jgi:hypothetical protein
MTRMSAVVIRVIRGQFIAAPFDVILRLRPTPALWRSLKIAERRAPTRRASPP